MKLHECRLTLAKGAREAGFDGVIYKSAQQYGMDCMAIFGPVLKRLRHAWSETLVDPVSGNLHWLIGELHRGAQIDVFPPG